MSTGPIIARFLAVGGAHVIVRATKPEEAHRGLQAVCESCGFTEGPYWLLSDDNGLMDEAQKHAETCRRIPERLWPKDCE
jgi:hypothetical protein